MTKESATGLYGGAHSHSGTTTTTHSTVQLFHVHYNQVEKISAPMLIPLTQLGNYGE